MMAIGKSKAKVYMEKDTKVTFADVAGVDEAKEELQEAVNFLKQPRSLSCWRRGLPPQTRYRRTGWTQCGASQ